MFKNLPANAEDMGWISGLGRSHVLQGNCTLIPQLLSLCSRAQEMQLLNPRPATAEAQEPWSLILQQKKLLQREAHAPLTRA